MARIICGANELEDDRWDGRTVAQIREELGQVLNIPEGAVTRLNGEEGPGANTALRAGDELEFVKPSGQKG